MFTGTVFSLDFNRDSSLLKFKRDFINVHNNKWRYNSVTQT